MHLSPSQVVDDPVGSKLLLIMDFVEGGPVLTRESLEKRDKLPESMARQYFRDMVKVSSSAVVAAYGGDGSCLGALLLPFQSVTRANFDNGCDLLVQ